MCVCVCVCVCAHVGVCVSTIPQCRHRRPECRWPVLVLTPDPPLPSDTSLTPAHHIIIHLLYFTVYIYNVYMYMYTYIIMCVHLIFVVYESEVTKMKLVM